MDFEGAIKRPFQDAKKLIIGIVLMIIPIVNFLSYGYILESTKLSFKGKKELPEWKNWGDLFVRGLLFTIIGLIYAIPFLILFFIGLVVAGLALFSAASVDTMGGVVTGVPLVLESATALIPFLIIGFILLLLTAYIVPSAALMYVQRYKFGDAFKFGTVFRKAFSGEYFVNWIVGMLVYAILVMILNFIPIVGAPIGAFIGMMFMFTLLGEVYQKIK